MTQEAAIGNPTFRINDEVTEDSAEQMITKITHVMNVNISGEHIYWLNRIEMIQMLIKKHRTLSRMRMTRQMMI